MCSRLCLYILHSLVCPKVHMFENFLLFYFCVCGHGKFVHMFVSAWSRWCIFFLVHCSVRLVFYHLGIYDLFPSIFSGGVTKEDRYSYRCNVEVGSGEETFTRSDAMLLRVKGKFAALWPAIGILIEVSSKPWVFRMRFSISKRGSLSVYQSVRPSHTCWTLGNGIYGLRYNERTLKTGNYTF